MDNNSKRSYNLSEVEEEALREYIRELMLRGMDVSEHDALYPKAQDWKDGVADLRADMTQLLKHIEDDEYKDGVEKIDSVTRKLKQWKTKIQKYLN